MDERRVLTLDHLLDVRTFAPMRSIALSPDGRRVAHATQRSGDLCYRRAVPPQGVPVNWEGCRLTVLAIDGGASVALAPETFAAWTPMWRPDSRQLAFLAAARREGPVELWAWDPDGGPARRVTPRAVHPHGVPRWFPDGRRMCVPLVPAGGGVRARSDDGTGLALFEAPAAAEGPRAKAEPWAWGDLAAVDMLTGAVETLVSDLPALEGFPAPQGGHLLWAEAAVQPDPTRFVLRYQLHLTRSDGWRGVVGRIESGVNWEHWEPHWSPNGRRFCAVVEGAVAVWHVERPEAPAFHISLPEGTAAGGWLAWTADGTGIVAWRGDRLWVISRAEAGCAAIERRAHNRAISGVLRRLDADTLPPGDLVVLAQDEIQQIPADSTEAITVAAGAGRFWGFRVADGMYALGDATGDGSRFVYAAGDPGRRADLWLAWEGGRQRRQLTDLNPHLAGIAQGEWQRFAFRTIHGADVGAAVLTPPGWKGGVPYPTVVCFYPDSYPSGAPGTVHPPVEPQLLAAQGYVVLLPDVPYDHLAAADPLDAAPAAVLPAVNEAIRLGYTDPQRLAVMGTSFGGTAVLGLLTRTGRFRVAVAEAGAADMASKYGEMQLALEHPELVGSTAWCETGQGGMGGPPWEWPLRYVNNSSVYFLDRVTTPLLLVAGSQDSAVSWAQSGEVFVGLRRLGRTCTLLVGRGEGHGISRWSEANRREAVTRILAWLDRYLGAG